MLFMKSTSFQDSDNAEYVSLAQLF